jgi:hypothetical protein
VVACTAGNLLVNTCDSAPDKRQCVWAHGRALHACISLWPCQQQMWQAFAPLGPCRSPLLPQTRLHSLPCLGYHSGKLATVAHVKAFILHPLPTCTSICFSLKQVRQQVSLSCTSWILSSGTVALVVAVGGKVHKGCDSEVEN